MAKIFANDDQKQKSKNHKIIKSFISGGFAGVCSKTLIAPIERVKYLFITSSRQFRYKYFFADFAYIVKKNGVFNLWRGNLVNVARIFPHAAIDFAVFDFLRGKFYDHDGSVQSKIILFFCGAGAGVSALTCTTPLQFLRVRLAMEKDNFSYKNNLSAFKLIFEKEGFLGFYKGYTASLVGIFIYHGFSFFIFTRLKEEIKKVSPDSYKKWYIDFALGAISSLGQIMAYPFDVLRKRMQGQFLLFEKKEIDELANYKTLVKRILEKEGFFRGFYKGLSLNMIKAPIASATAWTIKNNLNRRLDENYDL